MEGTLVNTVKVLRQKLHLVPHFSNVWHVADGQPLGGRRLEPDEEVRRDIVLDIVPETRKVAHEITRSRPCPRLHQLFYKQKEISREQ